MLQVAKLVIEWPVVLKENCTVHKALKKLLFACVAAAPVKSAAGAYLGVAGVDALYRACEENKALKKKTVGEAAVKSFPFLYLDSEMEEMPELDGAFLPVIDRHNNYKGVITSNQLLKILNKKISELRELANIVEKITITSRSDAITTKDLPKHILVNSSPSVLSEKVSNLQQILDEVEKRVVLKAIKTHGNTYKAAEALGISQPTFFRRLKKYRP